MVSQITRSELALPQLKSQGVSSQNDPQYNFPYKKLINYAKKN